MTRTESPAGTRDPAQPSSVGSPRSSLRRVGLLGTGYIADWHAKALASVPGVKLVAVCDRDRARAEAFARQFGVAGVHGSLDEMMAADRLDAVHVLLPPDLHFGATSKLLAGGIDVLLEKPMCVASRECDALVAQAATLGRSLGVAHNFLFASPWVRLRADVRAGLLGAIDHVDITWNKELPQATYGPFDAWMLRDPGNIMLEVGSHSVAHLVDLVGVPEEVRVEAGNPLDLPTGRTFWRRWRVGTNRGRTAAELRFSFIPGFAEHAVHVRGSLGSASVDFLRNTYVLRRHRPMGDDFDRFALARSEARDLRNDASATLRAYVLSKLHLHKRGSPYGAGIAGALEAFHGSGGGSLDLRVDGRTGSDVIRVCERIISATPPSFRTPSPVLESGPPGDASPGLAGAPRVLVLGATGFIGRELVRQLVAAGRRVRLLVRNPSKLPPDLRIPSVEAVRGDLESQDDLRGALSGIEQVFHLARANVKTWADYEAHEVGATRLVAEEALAAGVKRFLYTGTIDSYYAGGQAGIITESTQLDPGIERRNLYARAKAESEALLERMHRERGLPLVILRPGIVIGQGGSPFHWGVGMWWNGSVCQIWGDGRNKLPLVLVEDVASALVAALDVPGIEGESFNLVGDPLLTAQDYLDELDRAGGFRIQRVATPIRRFYLADLFKWSVKTLVRHPERRLPSYRDWESRTQRATFDCAKARSRLGWRPIADRAEFVRRGIAAPVREFTS